MKKTYNSPKLEVIKFESKHQILAGSDQTLNVTSGTYSGGFNGHESNGDWEEE